MPLPASAGEADAISARPRIAEVANARMSRLADHLSHHYERTLNIKPTMRRNTNHMIVSTLTLIQKFYSDDPVKVAYRSADLATNSSWRRFGTTQSAEATIVFAVQLRSPSGRLDITPPWSSVRNFDAMATTVGVRLISSAVGRGSTEQPDVECLLAGMRARVFPL
jgi:hypothetical protein